MLRLPDRSYLPKYVQMCFHLNPEIQLNGITNIRKLSQDAIQSVIESGVLPRIVEFLSHNDPKVIEQSAWCLANISSGTAEQTVSVIRYGAIPILIQLLSNKYSLQIQEQAIWTLGNIAGDSPECRNLCLSHCILNQLKPILCDSQCDTLLKVATWTLSNLARGKPSPQWKYFKIIVEIGKEILSTETFKFNPNNIYYKLNNGYIRENYNNEIPKTLTDLILLFYPATHEEILENICWAFSYLSDFDSSNNQSKANVIIDGGALQSIIDLSLHSSDTIKHTAIRTVGNLLTMDDMITSKVINLNVLNKFYHLLSMDLEDTIKREICWAISNITAGTTEQIQSVIDEKLIPLLIEAMKSEVFEIVKETCWCFGNLISGKNYQQIQYVVSCGIIPVFIKVLLLEMQKVHKQYKILMVLLEGIENILLCGKEINQETNKFAICIEEGGGVDCLQKIMENDNVTDDIYNKAEHIIHNYFDVEPHNAETENVSNNNSPNDCRDYQWSFNDSNEVDSFESGMFNEFTQSAISNMWTNEVIQEDNSVAITVKPAISLNEKDVDDGHENDILMDEIEGIKVYIWGRDVLNASYWKERATNTKLQFYKDKESGKIRLICRENMTLKLRMNQWILPLEMVNIERKNDTQISWTGYDITIKNEDNSGYAAFAVKFADRNLTDQFVNCLQKASRKNQQIMQHYEEQLALVSAGKCLKQFKVSKLYKFVENHWKLYANDVVFSYNRDIRTGKQRLIMMKEKKLKLCQSILLPQASKLKLYDTKSTEELTVDTTIKLLWPPSGEWQEGQINFIWGNGEFAIAFPDDPFDDPLTYRLDSYEWIALDHRVSFTSLEEMGHEHGQKQHCQFLTFFQSEHTAKEFFCCFKNGIYDNAKLLVIGYIRSILLVPNELKMMITNFYIKPTEAI